MDSFLKAADHFSHSFESVEIPYEGKTIPAYFYGASRSSSSPSRRPTLVVHMGFDGTQDELYSQCAVAALEREYNVITFEGPGQGRVIRKQGIPFRYDWEKVVAPVIDFATYRCRDDVDSDHVALMGTSLGG